jgi:hypothetical protein
MSDSAPSPSSPGDLAAILAGPVTSADAARAYLLALHAAGADYHPDDPAADIINGATGAPLFTPAEAALADARMNEVRAYLPDPCAVLCDAIDADNAARGEV